MAGMAATILLALAVQSVLADSPSAVADPDGYRASITADGLRELGMDPQQYEFQIPLGRLQFQRTYVRAGEPGLFSTGLTERGTDVIRLSLNPRSTLELTQDQASYELQGLRLTSSTKRTATLTQSFGSGATAGTFALTHTDTQASDIALGFTESRSDKGALTLGLGKSFGLTASAEDASSLTQIDTHTRRYDVALAPTGVTVPLAEYHQTISSVGEATTNVTQLTLRTPTIRVTDKGTVSASRSITDSSASGTDTVDTVSLAATPTDKVSVSAGYTATDREVSPGTNVTTVGSQIRVRPDTTVSARYANTETEGAGTTTQRSVGVTVTPTDGKGLGVEASVSDTQLATAELDPTIHVRLTYALPSRWEFTGLYHDENGRPDPELGAGVKMPVLGGALGLTYRECAYDPALYATRMTRTYGSEMTRPLLWGFSGRVAYTRTDNLLDPTIAERVQVGLGGPQTLLGTVDVQYQAGQLRTATGRVPDGSTVSLSLSRKIGLTELAVIGKHTLPSALYGPLPASDEVHVDLKAQW
jgi:hypothetical protein